MNIPHDYIILIPARQGSKGLKDKNIQPCNDVPLLVRCIQMALRIQNSRHVGPIVVSTDSPNYAQLAQQWGATTPFLRPSHLAADSASLSSVVLHAIHTLRQLQWHFTNIILLSPTTPLLDHHDIESAIDMFEADSNHSLAPVVFEQIPATWRFSIQNNTLQTSEPQTIRQRQSCTSPYRLFGSPYIASAEWLIEHRQFVIPSKTTAFRIPKHQAVDIEDDFDLKWAEFMLQQHAQASMMPDS